MVAMTTILANLASELGKMNAISEIFRQFKFSLANVLSSVYAYFLRYISMYRAEIEINMAIFTTFPPNEEPSSPHIITIYGHA